MNKILDIRNLNQIKQEKNKGSKVILVGGCFDILHAGHIKFLTSAKKLGGTVTVMLESDEKVKNLKGQGRPINSQRARALVLSNLPAVDYVILLPHLKKDEDYEILVKNLEPDIIAVTAGAKVFDWEKLFINETGGKIVEVIERLEKYSTTKIADAAKL